MRILVTGAGGLLGAAIVREFRPAAEVHAAAHSDVDITDAAAVAALVASVRPDVVVNCAAHNDVDGAQRDPGLTLGVNAFGVLGLARAAAGVDATFVHYSSDFVFDGETSRPYTEEDRANPQGVYAASKLLGDWFAMDAPRAYVFRVESLFGEPGPGGARRGSLATIVERIRAGVEVPVFVDRTVSPSYTTDIARATRAAIEQRLVPGLYHCVNEGAASWAEVATEAARLLGCALRMKPLTLQTARLLAPRPRYCALSPGKLKAAGVLMPPWQDALARHLNAGCS
ncbi:MAG: dTDP-4-dehydrorhamnose reductase [Acidobacteriota bacterium]|jgi:dTDP-4-dehydrorhamnose reductase